MIKDAAQELFYSYIPQDAASQALGLGQIGPIPNNGNLTGQVIMDSDSDFILQQIVFSATNNADQSDVTDSVPALIQVQDSTSQQTLFQVPAFIRNVCGTAQLPWFLPKPVRFANRSTLNVTIYNLDPANTVNFFIALSGIKDFTMGAALAAS